MQSPQKSPFGSRRKDANKLTEKPESPTESAWMWPCSGFLLWLLLRYLNGLGEGYTTGWLNHSGFLLLPKLEEELLQQKKWLSLSGKFTSYIC